ncbi:unnamed protein product [Malus baccata var. baccata]
MAYNVVQAQVEYQFENNCLSPMSLATAQIVEAKVPLRARRRGAKPFTSTLYDNTHAKYSWLLPGWIIEERVMMLTGRLYRVSLHIIPSCDLVFILYIVMVTLLFEILALAILKVILFSCTQLRAQGEEMKTCVRRVQVLVQAIQMSGLQISLPAPHLAPPSTSEPPCHVDTQ